MKVAEDAAVRKAEIKVIGKRGLISLGQSHRTPREMTA